MPISIILSQTPAKYDTKRFLFHDLYTHRPTRASSMVGNALAATIDIVFVKGLKNLPCVSCNNGWMA